MRSKGNAKIAKTSNTNQATDLHYESFKPITAQNQKPVELHISENREP